MISNSKKLLYTMAVVAVVVGLVDGQCYSPNGTAIDLTEGGTRTWKQCPSEELNSHTQCCADDEICMPMGLCASKDAKVKDKSVGFWAREYCSDPTWATSKCSNACIVQGFNGAGTVLTWCEDGSVCCGFESTTCCEKGQGQILDENGRTVATEATSTTSSSKKSETSSTTTPQTSDDASSTTSTKQTLSTPTPTGDTAAEAESAAAESESSTPETKDGLPTAAIAGIGAGAGVLAMLAIGGGYFLWRRMHKKRKAQAGIHPALYPHPGMPYDHGPAVPSDAPEVYLGGHKTGPEDSVNPAAELPHHYPQQYASELPTTHNQLPDRKVEGRI